MLRLRRLPAVDSHPINSSPTWPVKLMDLI
jgi:hypothetical protein